MPLLLLKSKQPKLELKKPNVIDYANKKRNVFGGKLRRKRLKRRQIK